jgi:hypothetical protein
MTKGRNIAASVRQRLLNASRARHEDFQVTLTRYALERLLYRLSKSAHRDQFIIKGAMLFSAWNEIPHRPTRDLDLLSFGASDISRLEGTFREIVNTEVEPDGLEFFTESLRGARIKEDQEYEGVRLSIQARLERARLSLQIDIGFGDAVTARARRDRVPDAARGLAGATPARLLALHGRRREISCDGDAGHRQHADERFLRRLDACPLVRFRRPRTVSGYGDDIQEARDRNSLYCSTGPHAGVLRRSNEAVSMGGLAHV